MNVSLTEALPSAENYTVCEQGHSHWGTAGAAGLFLKSTLADGTVVVLLQHRSPEVHEGDCWGVPGGAREWNENVLAGAVREARERARNGFAPDSS